MTSFLKAAIISLTAFVAGCSCVNGATYTLTQKEVLDGSMVKGRKPIIDMDKDRIVKITKQIAMAFGMESPNDEVLESNRDFYASDLSLELLAEYGRTSRLTGSAAMLMMVSMGTNKSGFIVNVTDFTSRNESEYMKAILAALDKELKERFKTYQIELKKSGQCNFFAP